MPTELHDPTGDELRRRFHELGSHLERSLDSAVSHHHAAPDPAVRSTRRRRMVLPVAAAFLLAAVGGAWLMSRGSGDADVLLTGDVQAASQPDGSDRSDLPAWPPPGEVHEHCVEDDATRAMYSESGAVSEEIRAQHCERRFHDLLVPVFTPDGLPDGAVSSAAMNDDTSSDELHALLTAHGLNSNDLAVQEAHQELWRAISNRHAMPVVDRDGEQIGWFGGGHEPDEGGFVSMEDMPKVRAEAERIIAEFERTGELPGSSPRIDALKAALADTAECLMAQGFGVHGPFPASDGGGLMYEVSSPPGGPALAHDNVCESTFNPLARDFALSAPLEDRLELVEEFNRVLACVDPTSEPRPTTASRIDDLVRDIDAEASIQLAMRDFPDSEHRCLVDG